MLSKMGWMIGILFLLENLAGAAEWTSGVVWEKPPVIEGALPTTTPPPEGAMVLFDGKDLSQFNGAENWTVQEGFMEAGKNSITTKRPFGSCRLHIEFATPAEVRGEGQGRGNSSVRFMENYEIQILDSYDNETYYDGQCGAIYKQNPPMRNVCRKPGEWQSYDITFLAPKFDAEGNLIRAARMTVYQNGELIQNSFELQGSTWFFTRAPSYTAHAPKLPLLLEYHGNPVRFRNIWIQEIED